MISVAKKQLAITGLITLISSVGLKKAHIRQSLVHFWIFIRRMTSGHS